MNTLRNLKVVALVAVTVGSLIGVSSSVHACPRSEYRSPEAALRDPGRTGNDATSALRNDPKDSSTIAMLQSGTAVDQYDHQKIAIAGLVAIASLSTATLFYKARLAYRKAVSDAVDIHPALEHPELALVNLPCEALPDRLFQPDELVSRRELALLP